MHVGGSQGWCGQSLGRLGAGTPRKPSGGYWGSVRQPGASLPWRFLEGTPLADGCDLCEQCAAGFLNWMRGRNPHQADHDGPGGGAG